MTERGSASLVVLVALGFAVVLVSFSADVALAAAARARAQTAADAAALAAAQELVVSSGTSPAEVAAQYAHRDGARLVSCECDVGSGEAVVTVEVRVELPFLDQTRTLRAVARAVVTAPPGTQGLQPFFIARLACLFERVPGVWIVSGFRTKAEQAALFEQKPGLAAPPGQSNHEVGLAADLGYPSDTAQRLAHVSALGCGLEFPVSYEPWHVEPVGV